MNKGKVEVEVVFNSDGNVRKFIIKRGWHRMKFRPHEIENLIKNLEIINANLCK